MTELPPLRYEATQDGVEYAIDELVPGFIWASAAHQFGEPVLVGTRLPAYATWLWEYVDKPELMESEHVSREQVIALYSFQMGVEWQRSRKRRKRMGDAVAEHHRQYSALRHNEYEPGDEVV